MSKKIFRVKLLFFQHFFGSKELKVPCFGSEYGSFFFNWSIETAKQFINHIMTIQPTKFYISSTSEVEAISSKTELFQKIMDSYNKTGNKRIDKFELTSMIPFIISDNYETAMNIGLKYFCLENEESSTLTKTEFGFYIDSLFTSLNNILILDENDEILKKTKGNIIKLGEEEIDTIINITFGDNDELCSGDLIDNIPKEIKDILINVNKALNSSLKYYENKFKKETELNS